MKKQIKLTLLGTMLFAGAISSICAGTEDAVVTPANTESVATIAPAEGTVLESAKITETTTEVKVEAKTDAEKTLLSRAMILATNKWVLGGAAVFGVWVAYKIYQAYTDEETEVEQTLLA